MNELNDLKTCSSHICKRNPLKRGPSELLDSPDELPVVPSDGSLECLVDVAVVQTVLVEARGRLQVGHGHGGGALPETEEVAARGDRVVGGAQSQLERSCRGCVNLESSSL